MTSQRIEELKKKRQKQFKKKKNQSIYGLILIFLAVIICIFFVNANSHYSGLWIIGILIGFILQRSRFCFTASFRDPLMVGSTSLFKAIIIAFIISTIGFGIIQYNHIGDSTSINLTDIPGQIAPIGLHTIIGAIMFGIGMVIAGGCASGTLMRIGEGFILQIFVLIGFITGTIMGASHYEFWDKALISKAPTIYIPKYTGMPLGIVGQVIVLIILYLIADWYDKKNSIMSM